ncbi:MAG: hypothetical protein IJF43_09740 [Firmicutes bacterium]|nr:hypothetical protein [Bacillota bacterium]
MKGSVRNVFPGNNSKDGFYSHYRSGLGGMEKVYILKGGPGTGKSTFMKELAAYFAERGHDVELWHCSSDCNSLDGVLIPDLKTAVVDGTSPHIVEPRYPGVKEEILNFADFWDDEMIGKQKERICGLTDRISRSFDEAYAHLAAAGEADGELLALRCGTDGAEKAEAIASEIFGREEPLVRHLFGAAITPEGIKDVTLDLCRPLKKRWFLRGKRGLGQQRCMEYLLGQGMRRGMAVEIYHGALDPEEILLLIFPEPGIAVAAVENLPRGEMREGDRIISFGGKGDRKETELWAEKRREEAIAAAVERIAHAHALHDELEACYIPAMDFEKVAELQKNLRRKITKKV